MLGLFLIYFIGKRFYTLAYDHDQSPWGYAILGVVSYYVCSFITGFMLVIIFGLLGSSFIEESTDLVLSAITLPFGIGGCVGLYYLLHKKWEKKAISDQQRLDELGSTGTTP